MSAPQVDVKEEVENGTETRPIPNPNLTRLVPVTRAHNIVYLKLQESYVIESVPSDEASGGHKKGTIFFEHCYARKGSSGKSNCLPEKVKREDEEVAVQSTSFASAPAGGADILNDPASVIVKEEPPSDSDTATAESGMEENDDDRPEGAMISAPVPEAPTGKYVANGRYFIKGRFARPPHLPPKQVIPPNLKYKNLVKKKPKRKKKQRSKSDRYSCTECDKAFQFTSGLAIHMRVHTGERPFQCSVCKKGFILAQPLRNHMRIHTGEKPYKCLVCPKAFRLKGTRDDHILSHTGEKPHLCTHCKSRFMFQWQLRKHNCPKAEGGDKTPDDEDTDLSFKCDHCSSVFTHRYKLEIHQCEPPVIIEDLVKLEDNESTSYVVLLKE